MKRVICRLPTEGVVSRGLLGQLLGSRGRSVGAGGAEVDIEIFSGADGFWSGRPVPDGFHFVGLGLVLVGVGAVAVERVRRLLRREVPGETIIRNEFSRLI